MAGKQSAQAVDVRERYILTPALFGSNLGMPKVILLGNKGQ